MIKRRNKNSDLPLGTHIHSTVDGSGRAVHMEAPIVRSAKNASPYTRNSYIWSVVSIFAIWWNWRSVWWHFATTYISCEEDECQLKVIPPARAKVLDLKFARDQIVDAKAIKVNADGEIVTRDSEEAFDSYAIILNQYGKDAALNAFEVQKTEIQRMMEESLDMEEIADILDMEKFGSAAMTDPALREKFQAQKDASQKLEENGDQRNIVTNRRYDLPNLELLKNYAVKEGDGQFLLILRKYSIGHKRRRVSALVNKVKSYANGQKKRLIIRENRNARWQGILGIVFGVFSLILSFLLGQFWEPEKQIKRKNVSVSAQRPRGNISYSNRRNSQGQTTYKPKAYGGYVPGKNSYTY